MVEIPQEYIIQQFYTFGIEPEFIKSSGIYRCGCPICREGKSLGRKKRCYYIPEKNLVTCHNCGWSSQPRRWIKKVANINEIELVEDIKDLVFDAEKLKWFEAPSDTTGEIDLPVDCIDLLNSQDIEFYGDDKIVKYALSYIHKRRLDTGKYRPKSLYITRDIKSIHVNRIIIPFYTADGHTLTFFQSRTLLDADKKPKFLSEGEKSLFNVHLLDPNMGTAYITEGPIEAFFIKNGLAVGGIQDNSMELLSQKQQHQWDSLFSSYDRVWVLDSQWIDLAAFKKSQILAELGEKIFIWPPSLGKRYKDINEIVVAKHVDYIPTDWINNHVYSGLSAKIRLSEIKQTYT